MLLRIPLGFAYDPSNPHIVNKDVFHKVLFQRLKDITISRGSQTLLLPTRIKDYFKFKGRSTRSNFPIQLFFGPLSSRQQLDV